MKTKCAVIVGILMLLAVMSRAAETPLPVVPEVKDVSEFYRPGLEISVFGGLDTPDLDSERSNVGFGGNLFITRNLGIGASTSFQDLSGSAFDNVSVRGIFRAPINRYAFYAYAGATRQLNEGEWSLNLGPGFEVRLNQHLGAWTEIGINKQLTGDREVNAEARVGLRWAF